jgi:hypothetical protein
VSAIDKLIAQHEQDMDQRNSEHQAFKRVLQSLKDGTMGVNDAFTRSGDDGGQKCQKEYKWAGSQLGDKPAEWQTFLIHIVESGSTPGNHIPYLEYAKAQGADFEVWDMFGRSLLHLVLDSNAKEHTEADLTWLLENTTAKNLINELRRKEGDPSERFMNTTPWSPEAKLQAILKKHGSNHS